MQQAITSNNVDKDPSHHVVLQNSANERSHYKVTLSLIGWVQAYNQPWQMCSHLSDEIDLTHCGLVMPYGDVNLGQNWLR